MIEYLSGASGIEAFTVAVEDLGWRAVGFAEIEPFPCAVLNYHYGCGAPENMPDPETAKTPKDAARLRAMIKANAKLPPRKKGAPPNMGDLRQLDGRRFRGVDVFVAGTPCQSFSVAGLREGLKDDRGNLTLEYVRILDECGATVALWENVPGVLSDEGNAFGCFLAALAGADFPAEPGPRPQMGKSTKFWKWDGERGHHVPKWPSAGWVAGPRRTVAWRVLDAQYFRLAQRRRRVFVAGCPCDGPDPREILFESGGVRRGSPPRRKAQAYLAGAFTAGAYAGGAGGRPEGAAAGHFVPGEIAGTLKSGGSGQRGWQLGVEEAASGHLQVTQSLTGRLGAGGPDDNKAQGGFYVACYGGNNCSGEIKVSPALQCNNGMKLNFEHDAFIVGTLNANGKAAGSATQQDAECGMLIAHPLRAQAQSAHDESLETYVTHALRGEGFDASEDGTGRGTPLVAALAIRGRSDGCNIEMRRDGLANTVCTQNGGRCGMGVGAVLYEAGVRRLLPVETERLMGFRDNYTLIPWQGKPAEECPDGPRYMTHGNSMPVPVMRWLARRTERVLLDYRARCAELQEAMA